MPENGNDEAQKSDWKKMKKVMKLKGEHCVPVLTFNCY